MAVRSGPRQIEMIMRGLERAGERVLKKLALDVTANLIESTPVDTGWARANWVPSIGVKIETTAPAAPEGSDVAAASARQGAGKAEIVTGYFLRRGKIHISNNVPYIIRLNEGSSQQAPAGFVQAAIRKAVTQDIKGL